MGAGAGGCAGADAPDDADEFDDADAFWAESPVELEDVLAVEGAFEWPQPHRAAKAATASQ